MKLVFIPLFAVGVSLLPLIATAGNSFLLSDGVNRAPAVTLHCVGVGSTAVPCGIPAQPLTVAPVAGGATASNQSAEILAQQSLAQSFGTPADPAYSGGAGSVIALLKAILAIGPSGNGSVGGTPSSRSQSIAAQQSVVLLAANPLRTYLAFQAPIGSGIWVNLIGGAAAPNAVDCAFFAAGSFYESGAFVNRSAISIYSPVAAIVPAWEN